MTSPIEKVEGFLYRAIPRTQQEAASQLAFTKVLSIAKSSIQWLIKSFLDGQNRNLLNLVAPFTIEWTSDSLEKDSRMRYIQLARMWQGLTANVPQILIADTGAKYISSGFSNIDFGVRLSDGSQATMIDFQMEINISVRLTTLDEAVFDQLFTVLNLIFGPLLKIGSGHTITPKIISMGQAEAGQEMGSWEVRLPLDSFTISGKTDRPRGDDPKDRVFTGAFDMVANFEDHIALRFDQSRADSVSVAKTSLEDWNTAWTRCLHARPDSKIPSRIRLREVIPIRGLPLPMGTYSYSDNPNVALVHESGYGGDITIHPKRIGKFNYIIRRKNAPLDKDDPGKGIIFQKEVQVVL